MASLMPTARAERKISVATAVTTMSDKAAVERPERTRNSAAVFSQKPDCFSIGHLSCGQACGSHEVFGADASVQKCKSRLNGKLVPLVKQGGQAFRQIAAGQCARTPPVPAGNPAAGSPFPAPPARPPPFPAAAATGPGRAVINKRGNIIMMRVLAYRGPGQPYRPCIWQPMPMRYSACCSGATVPGFSCSRTAGMPQGQLNSRPVL